MENTTKIRTEAEAEATIVRIAEENLYAVGKDIDAILETGEVLTETVLQGYLWDIVEAEVGEMDEETEELLCIAIVDYFCDQAEGLFDEEEED